LSGIGLGAGAGSSFEWSVVGRHTASVGSWSPAPPAPDAPDGPRDPPPLDPPAEPALDADGLGVGDAVPSTVKPTWLDPVAAGEGVTLGDADADSVPHVIPTAAKLIRAPATTT
jgi:hypothetical protein